jgi:hypothetical protein
VKPNYEEPLLGKVLTRSEQVAVEKQCRKNNLGCWLWVGELGQHDTPYFLWAGHTHLAAHVAFSNWVGPMPAGCIPVPLTCNHRRCVAPEHLCPMSPQDRQAWLKEIGA